MVYFTFIRTPHTFKWIMAAISLLFYFLIIFGFIGKQATLQNPRTFFAVVYCLDLNRETCLFQ